MTHAVATSAEDPTKRALSPARRRLVELMQWLSFGRILKLPVRNGEPVLDQTVRVIRTVKTGADNRPRAESHWRDFVLKREVMDLFAELGRIGNGVVRLIEVKHGLPFLIEIEEAVHT